MEGKINLLLVFTLVGSEMTYNGLNAIYEAKSYRLSLWQNFRLYWHTLFILPEPLDIQNLENEVDYRNYYFEHAIKRLKKMDSGTLIMALGKLVNRAVNITRRETGGWLIGQRQIGKEKKYIAVSEAAFASIDLNQCETMTDGLEEVVMPQDSLNIKLIFAAIKPTCHVTNYGCAYVLG